MSEQFAAAPDAAPPAEELTPERALQAANDRILALEAELTETKERWMRAEAENANVRARARKDVDDTRQYAVQKFATDVVEAAENLKRGMTAYRRPRPTSRPSWPRFARVWKEWNAASSARWSGTGSSPRIRSASPLIPTFTKRWPSKRAKPMAWHGDPSWSKAWTLNGRLLRPAMVVVAKAPTSELAGPAKA